MVPDQDLESLRAAATEEAGRHRRIIRSARGGGRLSALMLPLFKVRPPKGFGILTTTGRRTGQPRQKCIRMIRSGDRVYLVQLRPPEVAVANPRALAAWVLNLRSNPDVAVRLTDGAYRGRARLVRSDERDEARRLLVDTVHLFDYGECDVHLKGLPSRRKVQDLHRYWFDTGVPIVIEDLVRSS